MSQNQIEEIEISIQEAQKKVDLKNCVERLLDNKDFQKIITEGYFTNEPSRLVMLYSDPSMVEHTDAIKNDIIAIGGLSRYLRKIITFGRNMEIEIATNEETLEEIRLEELDDNTSDFTVVTGE